MRNALLRLLSLKEVKRKGWTRFAAIPLDKVESVADHSYGVALLAWLFCPEGLDRLRTVELALIHDLAEVLTGDITPFEGVTKEAKIDLELRALKELLVDFKLADRGVELLKEYQAGRSPEALFVKTMDKLEMSLQSRAYESAFDVDLVEFRTLEEDVLKLF